MIAIFPQYFLLEAFFLGLRVSNIFYFRLNLVALRLVVCLGGMSVFYMAELGRLFNLRFYDVLVLDIGE